MAESSWTLIVNPAAGHGAGQRLYPAVLDRLRTSGYPVTCRLSTGPGDVCHLTQQARLDGCNTIIALGGDGTLHEVLNGLGRTVAELQGVYLGIVPVGTGNSFLRDFGITGKAEQAVSRILAGNSRLVDVGLFDYRAGGSNHSALFINLLGLGAITDACRLANQRYKNWGTWGYILAMLQTMRTLRSYACTLTIDGRIQSSHLSLAAICNSQYTGGALQIAPPADISDGYLDLILFESDRRLELLRGLASVSKGGHLSHPFVTHTRGRIIEVSCDQPLPLMPDGEVYGSTPVRAEVWPGALQVLL